MKIPVRITYNKYNFLVHNNDSNSLRCIYSNVQCHTCNFPVNLYFKFPIGPRRNPLKPYNHVKCVKEVSVWTKRSTTVKKCTVVTNRDTEKQGQTNPCHLRARKHHHVCLTGKFKNIWTKYRAWRITEAEPPSASLWLKNRGRLRKALVQVICETYQREIVLTKNCIQF